MYMLNFFQGRHPMESERSNFSPVGALLFMASVCYITFKVNSIAMNGVVEQGTLKMLEKYTEKIDALDLMPKRSIDYVDQKMFLAVQVFFGLTIPIAHIVNNTAQRLQLKNAIISLAVKMKCIRQRNDSPGVFEDIAE